MTIKQKLLVDKLQDEALFQASYGSIELANLLRDAANTIIWISAHKEKAYGDDDGK